MSFSIWALFVLTEGVLCLTPGPAVLLVIAHALGRGAAAAAWATLGILSANALYFALSATGLGAVLLASHEAFALVRWMGAAYLVWLGLRLRAWRSSSSCCSPTAPALVACARSPRGRASLASPTARREPCSSAPGSASEPRVPSAPTPSESTPVQRTAS